MYYDGCYKSRKLNGRVTDRRPILSISSSSETRVR